MKLSRGQWAEIFLRGGLAFVFLYAAIGSLLFPVNWIGYLPGFIQYDGILILFSVYEILLGIWLLVGYKVYIPGIISSITLIGILITNFGVFDIVFRNVAALGGAIALAFLAYPKNKTSN